MSTGSFGTSLQEQLNIVLDNNGNKINNIKNNKIKIIIREFSAKCRSDAYLQSAHSKRKVF